MGDLTKREGNMLLCSRQNMKLLEVSGRNDNGTGLSTSDIPNSTILRLNILYKSYLKGHFARKASCRRTWLLNVLNTNLHMSTSTVNRSGASTYRHIYVPDQYPAPYKPPRARDFQSTLLLSSPFKL